MFPNSLIPAFRPSLLALGLAFASPMCPPVTGDDKPKPAEGSPSGEMHGGQLGKDFRDRAKGRLASIKLWGEPYNYVVGFQCTWSEAGKTVPGDVHGGAVGKETVFRLEEGEHLTEVSGTVVPGDADDTFIQTLTLKTNRRTLGPYGGGGTERKFEIDAPKGEEICGFRGLIKDGQVNTIGIVARPLSRPAPGDDKPRLAEGTPSGEIHGGGDGQAFLDRAAGKMTSIRIRSNEACVFSIQCTWTGPDNSVAGEVHGCEQGQETVVKLEEGEYLTEVSGKTQFGDADIRWVSGLILKTNQRTLGAFGNTGFGTTFEMAAPRGEEICGFRGRSSRNIDALGIVVRPIPKP